MLEPRIQRVPLPFMGYGVRLPKCLSECGQPQALIEIESVYLGWLGSGYRSSLAALICVPSLSISLTIWFEDFVPGKQSSKIVL
jgi:hypothetical protein